MSEVPYAGELSQQLLKHAEKLEKLYKKLGQAMATNAAEKVIKSFLAEVEEANAFTSKAQAWCSLAGVASLLFIAGLWLETIGPCGSVKSPLGKPCKNQPFGLNSLPTVLGQAASKAMLKPATKKKKTKTKKTKKNK